ncbi:MAG: M14 family zinc carboxypeptidase [Saprospiraceae bacterium]
MIQQLVKQIFITILFFSINLGYLNAQKLQNTKEFLGYTLGDKFTFHHRVIDYFEHVATNSNKVQLHKYGKSSEGRPLMIAIVSAEKNMEQIEAHQKANLEGLNGKEKSAEQLPIVWLSYNVHGDEAAATEAALATLETLVSDDKKIEKWLEDVIIIMDPCINPDGRDRYAMWINQVANFPSNPDISALEHHQPWPGGRFNHYLFDLNRDWAWQVQHESQVRVNLYQQWMPHVHVDFHEMGHQSSYFFAPAAEPMHEMLTDWQREFQVHVGRGNANYFDEKGWFYYTKETYDLLYPSYGDTWPIFNGAIGFTYEQGGSGRAGIAVEQETGQILTLAQRLEHHKTTGLSTIETAYNFRKKLLDEFNNYFAEARENPKGRFKTYVVKSDDEEKIFALCRLLDNQKIHYTYPLKSGTTHSGYNYLLKENSTFELSQYDLVIPAKQTQSNILTVLFEPETKLQDSLTYDLTAWALPYVYGLQTFGMTEELEISLTAFVEEVDYSVNKNMFAYIAPWKSLKDIQFLSAAINAGLKTRFLNKPTTIEGKFYERGSIILAKADNTGEDFIEKIEVIKKATDYYAGGTVKTGMVELGSDLGAKSIQYIKPPKVALLGGSGVSPTAFGEVWDYMEQQIKYPVSILHTEYFRQIDLNEYDVLILVSGRYNGLRITSKIMSFIRNGGKVISLGNSNQIFVNDSETQLNKAVTAERNREDFGFNPTGLKRYENRERDGISNTVAGSIYKVYLDNTHPLAYGYDTTTYIIKQNRYLYPLLRSNSWNVGMFKDDSHISGFVGANLKPKIPQTMAFGVERLGRGDIVYMCDSPIFRGFWYSGNLVLANAIFFVD